MEILLPNQHPKHHQESWLLYPFKPWYPSPVLSLIVWLKTCHGEIFDCPWSLCMQWNIETDRGESSLRPPSAHLSCELWMLSLATAVWGICFHYCRPWDTLVEHAYLLFTVCTTDQIMTPYHCLNHWIYQGPIWACHVLRLPPHWICYLISCSLAGLHF